MVIARNDTKEAGWWLCRYLSSYICIQAKFWDSSVTMDGSRCTIAHHFLYWECTRNVPSSILMWFIVIMAQYIPLWFKGLPQKCLTSHIGTQERFCNSSKAIGGCLWPHHPPYKADSQEPPKSGIVMNFDNETWWLWPSMAAKRMVDNSVVIFRLIYGSK